MSKNNCLRRIFSNFPLTLLIIIIIGILACIPARNAKAKDIVCVECHEDVQDFEDSYHGRAWLGTNQEYTCQSCHGTTDRHVDAPSSENILTSRQAKELNSKCLGCHATTNELQFWELGKHNDNDVACASCHTIHTSRSSVKQMDVCFECHRSTRLQVTKRSRHPLAEGKIKCSDCHNPHGTDSSHNMIRAENVNQLCYQCHPDKRGPYAFEHPPVEENCANCHTPHGSRHAKLLAEKVPNICQDCHHWSRHPATPYDGERGFSGSSPVNRFFARSCLNCHGAIHGSSDLEHRALTR